MAALHCKFQFQIKKQRKSCGFSCFSEQLPFHAKKLSWRKGLLVLPALTALVKDVQQGCFQLLALLSVAVHWDPFSIHRVMHMEDVSHPEGSCLMLALNQEGMMNGRRNAGWKPQPHGEMKAPETWKMSWDVEDVLTCRRCQNSKPDLWAELSLLHLRMLQGGPAIRCFLLTRHLEYQHER